MNERWWERPERDRPDRDGLDRTGPERTGPGNGPKQPRAEPEIIPPDKTGRDRSGFRRAEMHIVFGEPDFRPGFQRVTFARPGLFAIVMGALALGAVAAALILLLLGTLFVALPVIGALIVIGFITAVVRGLIRGPARLH